MLVSRAGVFTLSNPGLIMTRIDRASFAAAMGLSVFFAASSAHAHCFVGSRFFPATASIAM